MLKGRTEWWLCVVGLVCALLGVCVVYELYAATQYSLWKRTHKQQGWLAGAPLTVKSSNEKLKWEYAPNRQKEYVGVLYETNAHGFRDHAYELSKPAETFRIAFVGDSVTMGFHNALDDAFVKQLEQRYQQAHQGPGNVECLQCAVNGYHAGQIAELIRATVLSFQPDAIVYMLHLNDFDWEDAAGNMHLYFQRPRRFLPKAIEKLTDRLRFGATEYYHRHFLKKRAEVMQAIAQMADDTRRADTDFIVVILPTLIGAAGFAVEDYYVADLHEQIREACEQLGVSVIDLRPLFEARGLIPEDIAVDSWHFNAAGNRIVAEILEEQLPFDW